MSNLRLQEEEREVLLAIYDGDPAFKQLSSTTFQYKYGDDNDKKSFLIEISWDKSYPSDKPNINMDAFYNKHILPEVKKRIVSCIAEEAGQYLGEAMTYTLFEYVKDKAEDFIVAQPQSLVTVPEITSTLDRFAISESQELKTQSKPKEKKWHLTKTQKRKQWDRVDDKGDKPRGWDWVDVVKHLSQTGSKQASPPSS